MKILVAVPCMDTMPTPFVRSLVGMRASNDWQLEITFSAGSLIYDSRNLLSKKAVEKGFDRVLWLDSDMTFDYDLMIRMNEHLDNGCDYVSGMYYTRKKPIHPVVYSDVGLRPTEDGKGYMPYTKAVTDYPDGLFEVAATGFGAVMVKTSCIEKLIAEYGLPFAPAKGFGEDLSFCMRMREQGFKMWCDSTIKCGHVGQMVFDESVYRGSNNEN